MSSEYQCANCKGVFEKTWTDEEAAEEYRQKFGCDPELGEDADAMVCDDCYNKIMAWAGDKD